MARILPLALLLATSPAWCGQPPQGPTLHIPQFAELRRQADESVELTLGPLALGFVRWVMPDDADDEGATLLRGMKRVTIRHYEFSSDATYPQAKVDAIRSQLDSPGWSRIIKSRNNAEKEDVDIYVSRDGEHIKGLAIVAVEPREFTVINVVGKLDEALIGQWQAEFLAKNEPR